MERGHDAGNGLPWCSARPEASAARVAWRLRERGWSVRAIAPRCRADGRRGTGRHFLGPGRRDAARGCSWRRRAGVSLIVHAVNPPGYRNWGELVLPMLENTHRGRPVHPERGFCSPARSYNYGPDAFADIDETSPQNPMTRKRRHSGRNGAASACGRPETGRENVDRAPPATFFRAQGRQ